MKKRIVIAIIATVLLGAASFAEARDGHREYRSGHHNSYRPAHYGHKRSHYNRGYSNYRYNRYYGRSGYSNHYSGHHDHYKGLKIAAGAIALGSLVYAINNDRHDRVVYRTRRVAPASDYWYRVDTDGQCVEVRRNQQGQEVWTYVDASYCN